MKPPEIWALFPWARVSGIHLLLRWQLPTVGWTACGLWACIVEKYVWFSAVLHVADESGSALVHGVASVTADRLAPKRVFGSLLYLTRARRPSGWYTVGTLLQVAWSRLFTFLLRWLAVPRFR